MSQGSSSSRGHILLEEGGVGEEDWQGVQEADSRECVEVVVVESVG